MNQMPAFHQAGDAGSLAQDLARQVAQQLQSVLAERGEALLVVSGGSTPIPFFEALARIPLDWSRVTVTLADERWVPPTHQDSNERLVRERLLQHQASRARFVPMYNGAATPEQGLAPLNETMSELPWPAAAMVLGMGGDGHTASLFPSATPDQSEWLAHWEDGPGAAPCIAIAAPAKPNVPVPRTSLSPHALLDAEMLVLHVTGDSKIALLGKALQDGPVTDLPVRVALHQERLPCHVFQSP